MKWYNFFAIFTAITITSCTGMTTTSITTPSPNAKNYANIPLLLLKNLDASYVSIPLSVALHAEPIQAMLKYGFTEQAELQKTNAVVLDMTPHRVSNQTLSIFSTIMHNIIQGTPHTSLLTATPQEIQELRVLTDFFLLNPHNFLLHSIHPLELLFAKPHQLTIPIDVSWWKIITINQKPYALIQSNGKKQNLVLWDIEKKQPLVTLCDKELVTSLQVHEKNNLLATASKLANNVTIWDVEKKSVLLRRTTLDCPEVLGWANDHCILIKHSGTKLVAWDIAHNIDVFNFHATGPITNVHVINTNKILVTCYSSGVYMLYYPKGNVVQDFARNNFILTAEPNPQRTHLALSLINGTIQIWNLHHGTIEKTLSCNTMCPIMLWNSQGNKLALRFDTYETADRSTVQIWNSVSGELEHVIEHSSIIDDAVWSHDGRFIATGSHNGVVNVFDTLEKKSVTQFLHNDWITSIAWAHDNTYLIVGDWSNAVTIWHVPTKQLVHKRHHDSNPEKIRWIYDHKLMVTEVLGCGLVIQEADIAHLTTDFLWNLLLKKQATGHTVISTMAKMGMFWEYAGAKSPKSQIPIAQKKSPPITLDWLITSSANYHR